MVWFIPLIAAALSTGAAASAASKQRKLQKGAQGSADAIEAEKLRLSRQQQAQSDEQYARYQRTYVPIEDQLIREAMRKAQPDVEAGLASADVESALATQRGALSRQIGRRGINPNDGAVADAEARLALAGGKAKAAASTMARRNAIADRNQRLGQVAAMGRSLPGTAYNFSAQAGAGLSDINALRQWRLNNQNQMAGQAGSELGLSLADVLQSAPQIVDGFNTWRNNRPISEVRLRHAA